MGVTARLAEPPRLLLTVMFCGFEPSSNWPWYWPLPLFCSVPMSAPEDVTKAFKVAVELVLVAWTFSTWSDTTYSARVIVTVSVVPELEDGVTVMLAVALVPPPVAVMVAELGLVCTFVVTLKVALLAPAATVTLAGTVATAVLLLLSVTCVPPLGAAAPRLTVP